MKTISLIKQIILQDIEAVGITRAVLLYLATAATIGCWILVALFI